MSSLYLYKCAHFFLSLSLSTVLIHQLDSYTRFSLWFLHSYPQFSAFPTNSSHFRPDSQHSSTDSPHSHHSHLDSPHFHRDSRIPIIPLIPFPDFQFQLLQIAAMMQCFKVLVMILWNVPILLKLSVFCFLASKLRRIGKHLFLD